MAYLFLFQDLLCCYISGYASFRHFFASTCVKLVCQILMSGDHVFLNLRQKPRKGLSELCAKMTSNLNAFKKSKKIRLSFESKNYFAKVYFLIWTFK